MNESRVVEEVHCRRKGATREESEGCNGNEGYKRRGMEVKDSKGGNRRQMDSNGRKNDRRGKRRVYFMTQFSGISGPPSPSQQMNH